MQKNMGTVDRALRTLLALLVAVLYFRGSIGGTLALVLGALAVVFLLTSFVGWCPLYSPLRLSTRKPRS